jgi:hypothetical protein
MVQRAKEKLGEKKDWFVKRIKIEKGPGTVAQAYNPSYSGGKNQENYDSRPAWAKNS